MLPAIERNVPLPHFQIKEDSVLCKALSCIPLLGAIPSFIQFSRLNNKQQETYFPATLGMHRKIELMRVSNDYMKANLLNALLCIAIAVSLLYFGIFIHFGAMLLPFGLILAALSLHFLSQSDIFIKQFPQIMKMHRQLEDLKRGLEYTGHLTEHVREFA